MAAAGEDGGGGGSTVPQPPCFGCLERRIKTDLSCDGLVVEFLHGESDSPLPFGSGAVVKITVEGSGEESVRSGTFRVELLHDWPLFFGTERVPNSAVKQLVMEYLCSSTESHIISSLNSLVDNQVGGWSGLEFFSLVGISTYNGIYPSGNVRHPNIWPVTGVLQGPICTYLLSPKVQCTLENLLHYSPKALQSDWHIRFILYQMVSALAYMHNQGIFHGNLCPSTIYLSDTFWLYLGFGDSHLIKNFIGPVQSGETSLSPCCFAECCSYRTIHSDSRLEAPLEWQSCFKKWWVGELSNYEYLIVLNKLSGRRWGDPASHMVLPWVIDFSAKPVEDSEAGWRDLTKSKWRLAKGDEQLDFTYSTSEVPHHVSDECLSELAVCSYKARRLPKAVLQSAVRSVYEPNEYPSSMQRLYQWTPDECIPEFYSDPEIFVSVHSDMSDLGLPAWATNKEEFISLHRDALESCRVSEQLHHWIDITFGYKLYGQAAVQAKNVMLPSTDPLIPKSVGRRQLFRKPHPKRRGVTPHFQYHEDMCVKCSQGDNHKSADATMSLEGLSSSLILETYLEDLEQAYSFADQELHLHPVYSFNVGSDDDCSSIKCSQNEMPCLKSSELHLSTLPAPSPFDLGSLLDSFEEGDNCKMSFPEFLLWQKSFSCSSIEHHAVDIFSFGCILAELYLQRPLFDYVSVIAWKQSGTMPRALLELPSHVKLLVESCLQKEWSRRPSAKSILESPYFPHSVRSAHIFLAPLQLICEKEERLKYASKLANSGALKAMGELAAEACLPFCLPLIGSSLSDSDAEPAFCLLQEFVKCSSNLATKKLLVPIIQKISQVSEYSQLKVALLQHSFIKELWKKIGKQAYLEKIHPIILSNLFNAPNKISASAASVVLIGTSEELGVPITVHQIILPLLNYFGKGLCTEVVDTLVRIGGVLGESFVVKQLLPRIRIIIQSSIDALKMNQSEPQQSWNSGALLDGLVTLDGLVSVLPIRSVLRELVQDQICLHIKVLMQTNLDMHITQVAAIGLIELCRRIGPQFSIPYVLPQLKELFIQLALLQAADTARVSASSMENSHLIAPKNVKIHSRMDLVLLLYPFLASFLGMEKLREYCSTWFLLEQILRKNYNWRWESLSGYSGTGDISNNQRIRLAGHNPVDKQCEFSLHQEDQFIPLSEGVKHGADASLESSRVTSSDEVMLAESAMASVSVRQPWFWFPHPDANFEVPYFLGRGGGGTDSPWKIKASILSSARAHHGALRSLAICHDECTIFTCGGGPGFKGSIQRWDVPNMKCTSAYYGHEEVVNSICLLSVTGKVASCDGTVHVWNGQTGKLISAYAEAPTIQSQSIARVTLEQINLAPDALSEGLLSNGFSGSLYSSIHYIASEDKLVAGMGNGSIRFIDIHRDQKLHLWKSDSSEYSLSSLVSAICSCGSEKLNVERSAASSSWIAVGFSSGQCRLLDERSGNIVMVWRAHDGYITKLAAPEDHLIVSSSLDRSIRIWDLRRNPPNNLVATRIHSDAISSFAIWGQDVISVSRSRIALTSLSRFTDQSGSEQLLPQNLYTIGKGTRNMAVLSAIGVLPYSRLFAVGTEDGYLKICC